MSKSKSLRARTNTLITEDGEYEIIKKPRSKKAIVGRPFVPGDPRINRRGRPVTNFNAARKLFQEVFSQYVKDPETGEYIIDEDTGLPITALKWRMQQAALSPSPAEFLTALTFAFGKPREEIDVNLKHAIKIVKVGIDSDEL